MSKAKRSLKIKTKPMQGGSEGGKEMVLLLTLLTYICLKYVYVEDMCSFYVELFHDQTQQHKGVIEWLTVIE